MPSAAARRNYEDQIPSFMSVFDLDAEVMADRDTVTVVNPRLVALDAKESSLMHSTQQPQLHPPTLPGDSTHRHHDSTSTQMSESADSSPTTTLSTTDSSPLSDPSPSSSPDSPVHLIPLNNFPATSFEPHTTNVPLTNAPPPTNLERPMTSPGPRRARNMKGLSIQPPIVASTIAQNLVSEPCSPAFIKPAISTMKRKPSHLSLKTSTSDLVHKAAQEVPPSPAMPPILQRRALKHSASSPHMLSVMKSSTFGPAGGMSFPKVLERNESGLSEVLRPMKSSMRSTFNSVPIEEEDSPIRTQMANRAEFEPHAEKENNEDQKTPGYPDGPIAIYGDNVYLYLEPTAEEASRFDLVINVAREVKNPFDALPSHPSQPREEDLSPIPDTALSNASFATAFEHQPDDRMETPTTPKANPFKTPEYIHIPWDHNTDIAPDLMRLCETIDNRTKQGKKVLIHCQQGASRSASLIIAYGLYQKPELSVNDAYYAAQKKSRWISPNMKLMYSLQDFQKELSKKRLPPASAYHRTGRSPTKHRLTMSVDAIDTTPTEPQTAPLPGEDSTNTKEDDSQNQSRPRGHSTPGRPPISPGPASAPATCSWQELVQPKASELLVPLRVADIPPADRPKPGLGDLSSVSAPPGDNWFKPPPSPGPGQLSHFGFQSIDKSIDRPRVQTELPLRTLFENGPALGAAPATVPIGPSDDTLLSPRVEMMTNNPLHQVSDMGSMHFIESPPTPDVGLFSPRATMFPRNPLRPFGRPPQFHDPRSPPTKGETPITRSIDDVL